MDKQTRNRATSVIFRKTGFFIDNFNREIFSMEVEYGERPANLPLFGTMVTLNTPSGALRTICPLPGETPLEAFGWFDEHVQQMIRNMTEAYNAQALKKKIVTAGEIPAMIRNNGRAGDGPKLRMAT